MPAKSNSNSKNEKVSEAFQLLEEFAVEKKDEIKSLVSDKYSNLKEALGSRSGDMRESLDTLKNKTGELATRAKDISAEKVKDAALAVDESAHKNPWPYIGSAAVGGLLLGYILGKK